MTKYTIEFIRDCWLKYGIFNVNEITGILIFIKDSKFRVKEEIIESILSEIRNSTGDEINRDS